MNVDMTKSYAFTFYDTDGGTTIAVEKSSYAAESFNAELETEYRSRIGLEAWGDNKVDNNAWGDIKVDNKVDDNAKGDNKVDIKVDNNIWDDTVNRSRIGLEIRDDTENDTVNRFQTRNRTTTPYNTRTRSVQHSYKKQMYATSMDVWYNAHRTMISVEGRQ